MDELAGVKGGRQQHFLWRPASHHVDEVSEEEGRVLGPAARLGMELRGEEGPTGVDDAFVAMVVGVEEEGLPIRWQRVAVHCIAVVLWSDVALGGAKIDTGLVHATVAILHLVRFGAARQGQQLVAQTYAKDGFGRFQRERPAHGSDGRLAHGGVTRPVTQKHAFVGDLYDGVSWGIGGEIGCCIKGE